MLTKLKKMEGMKKAQGTTRNIKNWAESGKYERIKVENEVKAWEQTRNAKTAKINWQFTNEKARIKLKRLYPSLHD